MTLFQQLIDWAQNQWLIVVILAAAGLIVYLSGLLQHVQTLYAKLFSGERILKKGRLEFVRIEVPNSNVHWRISDAETVRRGGSRYPATDYLDRATTVLEMAGRYDHEANPVIDIILSNESTSSKILLAYGLEVLDARYRVISAGSVTKITLDESDHYRIDFPIPRFVTGEDAMDESGSEHPAKTKMAVDATTYNGDGSLSTGDPGAPGSMLFWEWEWAETPVVSMSNFPDPPQLDAGAAYRFTLEIAKSKRMPTDTLLRVVIDTSNGQYKSDDLYFLKP